MSGAARQRTSAALSLVAALALAGASNAEPEAAAPAQPTVAVRLVDRVVFSLPAGEVGTARARAAAEALRAAAEQRASGLVRVEERGALRVVLAGDRVVIELAPQDASLVPGASLDAHAQSVAESVRGALRAEERRSAIAGTVFSLSLVVTSALLALALARRVGALASSLHRRLVEAPDGVAGLRVRGHELIGPTAARGALVVVLVAGRAAAQVGVVAVWLGFSLSLFEATRPVTARLTALVVSPLSGLAERLVGAVPLAVLVVVSGAVLYVLLRFVQVFFEGVERGQTEIPGLAPELARPTASLVGASLLLGALVLGAPVVTGDPGGALARVGVVALGVVGLA
ncbi:MAG: mechanosensitive ion channel family protein, partial [Deltaproteobacteria bacterium]|nr:mechanosensitive ion channel family protein [Deltaproteobacteria bacterium]